MAIFSSSARTRRHRQAPPQQDLQQQEQQPFFAKAGESDAQRGAQPFFQPKLTIGRPDDPYEREADTVADAVVNQQSGAKNISGSGGDVQRMPITPIGSGGLQRAATPEEQKMPGTNDARMEEDKAIQEKPLGGGGIQKMEAPGAKEEEKPVQKMSAPEEEEPVQKAAAPEEEEPVQTKAEEEEQPVQAKEEEEEPVQTKSAPGTPSPSASFGKRLSGSKGGGQPLPKSVRTEMEQGIGADFSKVRVHTDSEAATMNKDVHAQAFTHGQDVYFSPGKFDPEQTEGKRLLAHELTHVVQQGASKQSAIRRKVATSRSEDKPDKKEDWGAAQTTERTLPDGRTQQISTVPFVQTIARKEEAAANETEAEQAPADETAAETVVLGDILPAGEALSSSLDAIAPTLTHVGSVSRGGGTPGGFGVTNSDLKFENVTVTSATGTFTVKGDMKHTITWQVRTATGPRSQVSIASEKDPAITKTNYPTVASDLTPNMSDLNGRPPRTKFWAEDLTIQHEKYHAEKQRNAVYGPKSTEAMQKWMAGQTASSEGDIKTVVLPKAMNEGIKVFNAFVRSASDEEDAYGDGAASYKSRADSIKTTGDKGGY